MWADVSTLSFTEACGGSGTSDDNVEWTVESDAAESTYDNTKGIHYGTSKVAVSYLNLTTSGISGTITKIIVNASGASGTSAKLNITVGGDAFGSEQSLTASATNYTLTGSASGEIVVAISQSSAKKALYCKSIEVTYSSGGGGPTTYTVSYAANGGTGTMTDSNSPYAAGATVTLLSNTFTAPSGKAWDSWSVKDASNNTVSVSNNQFTMPASNVTVTAQWVDLPSYTITAQSNNNNYGTVSLEGNVITGNPASGYRYASPAYTVSGSATVVQDGNEFTVTPTSNCTVTINFEAIPTHNATFSVNGETTNQTFAEGAAITFPANPASISGKSFVGWTTATISGTTNTAPTPLVTSATMGNSDVTYYAVFATVSGSTTPANMVINTSTTNFPTSYGTANTFAEYTLNGKKFQIQQGYINGTKLQWRASGNTNGTGTMYNSDAINKIQSIVLEYASDDANKNFTVQVGTSANPSSASTITPSVSQQNTSEYTFNCSSGDYDYFVLTNGSGAGYLTSITINYLDGTTTYSNYCTSVVITYSVTYDANGATSGSVPTDATAYSSGATVTVLGNTGSLTNTGYAFGGWNTQADGQGTNYAANATFNITANTTLYAKWNAKTITGLSYTGTPTKTTYSAGESFDPTGLTVTATYNDESQENVTASVTWTPDPLTQGTTSVTGTYLGQTVIVNGLNVTAAAGSAENPYTVAQARAAIDAANGETLAGKYATGIVSAIVTEYSSQHGNITYDIIDEGGSNTLRVYRGTCSGEDEVRVGDVVVVSGDLILYNSETYEFSSGSTLQSLKLVKPTFSPVAGAVTSGTTVTISDAHTGATIYYTTDGTNPTERSSEYSSPISITTATTLKAIAVKSGYTTSDVAEAAYTINVTPTISLSSYSVEATCAETDGSLTVTCDNIDTSAGVEIVWYTDNTSSSTTTEPDWIDTEITTTTLNYEIAANTGDARTAYFKVYGLDEGGEDVYSDLVTISQAAYVPTTTYTLATSVTSGKTYIIASGKSGSVYAMGYDKGNNRDAVSVTAEAGQSTNTITVEEGSGIYEMVLYGADANGYYTFYDANRTSNEVAAPGYLYAVGGSNYLKTQSTNVAEGKWTISFGNNDNAIITAPNAKNGNDARIMRFNNGNSKLFSCYTSGQQDIYLYEKADAAVATTVSKTLNSYGYATFATTTALDFLDAENASYSAWQITGISGSTITFGQITNHVAAGKGILLKGSAGATINLNILPTGGATLSGNKLVGTTSDFEVENDGDYYGLSGNTFVPVNAGTVPAGKALLPASEVTGGGNGVKSFTFVFNGADGITETMQVDAETARKIFDLNGRQLQKPQRGINIVNGKKVLVK